MFEDDKFQFEDDEFQWDVKKAAENFRKHGVRFEEARMAFDDSRYIYMPDKRKNYGEDRFQAIGKVEEKYYTVVYTVRDDKRRIITAWESEDNEKKKYDNSPGSDLSHEEFRRYVHNIRRKKERRNTMLKERARKEEGPILLVISALEQRKREQALLQ